MRVVLLTFFLTLASQAGAEITELHCTKKGERTPIRAIKLDMVKENVLQCEQRTGIGCFTGYENILTLSWNKHSITWIESTQSGYFHELFMLQRDRGDLQRGGVMAMEFNFFEKVNDMLLSRYGMFWTCKKYAPLF